MTMEVAAVDADFNPDVLEHVKIPDPVQGGWEIDGFRIADVSTEHEPNRTGGKRARWSHDKIWRLSDGKYALYRSSWSHVYHTDPTACRTKAKGQNGTPIRADALPADAVACWVCEPPYPDELDPGEMVRFEGPRQSMAVCEEPHQIIGQLTTSTRYSGAEVSGAPDTTVQLIQQARINDEYFRSAEMPMRKIG
jgi:hypothetical protein